MLVCYLSLRLTHLSASLGGGGTRLFALRWRAVAASCGRAACRLLRAASRRAAAASSSPTLDGGVAAYGGGQPAGAGVTCAPARLSHSLSYPGVLGGLASSAPLSAPSRAVTSSFLCTVGGRAKAGRFVFLSGLLFFRGGVRAAGGINVQASSSLISVSLLRAGGGRRITAAAAYRVV